MIKISIPKNKKEINRFHKLFLKFRTLQGVPCISLKEKKIYIFNCSAIRHYSVIKNLIPKDFIILNDGILLDYFSFIFVKKRMKNFISFLKFTSVIK